MINTVSTEVCDLPRLFHGTTPYFISHIMQDGLRPSSELGGLRMYSSMQPATEYVYLSTFRTFHYALHSASAVMLAQRRMNPNSSVEITTAIVEIDAKALDTSLLRPDDDLLVARGGSIGKTVEEHKAAYEWVEANANQWPASLAYYGTLAYKGSIPPSAIKKIGLLQNNLWCHLTAAVEHYGMITDQTEWDRLRPMHETIMKLHMGDPVEAVDFYGQNGEILTPEQANWCKGKFEKASRLIIERSANGEWTERRLGFGA